MSLVYFELNNCITFDTFVSQRQAPGLWLPAQVPQVLNGAGIYVIFNSRQRSNNANDYNRYIGISGNLNQRFGDRQATLVELGFTRAELDSIFIYWGRVMWWNTGQLYQPFPAAMQAVGPFGPGAAVAQGPQGLPVPALPAANMPGGYGPQQCVGNVDGQNVDFENLLIRFYFNGVGTGGTLTNTRNNQQIQNGTNDDMRVIVGYPTQVGGPVNAKLDATLFCQANAGNNRRQAW